MKEFLPGAQTIYRHAEQESGFSPPGESCLHLDAITAHVEKHIGPVDKVMHELISDKVHHPER